MRSVLEDNFYFCGAWEKWAVSDMKTLKSTMPPLPVPSFMQSFVLNQIRKNIKQQCIGQGIGRYHDISLEPIEKGCPHDQNSRHTLDEIRGIGLEDLKTISNFLADKQFLMGDQPSEVRIQN